MSPRAWSFSQRKGLTPAPVPVQLESLDQRLRNDVWNLLYSELLNTYPQSTPYTLRNFWWHHYPRFFAKCRGEGALIRESACPARHDGTS